MKEKLLAMVDNSRGVWVVQYREKTGEMIVEPTRFASSMPSIVVCDELQKDRPGFAVFAKIN